MLIAAQLLTLYLYNFIVMINCIWRKYSDHIFELWKPFLNDPVLVAVTIDVTLCTLMKKKKNLKVHVLLCVGGFNVPQFRS